MLLVPPKDVRPAAEAIARELDALYHELQLTP